MKKLIKIFMMMALLAVGSFAIFVHYSDQPVVVLKDGTIKAVDVVWESESGALISYTVDGETILLNRDEIKSYG
jgi:hypothetical protein